jgi:hypothetical protein
MTTTALAAGGPNMQMPCPSTAVPLWYGDQIKNWRGCLEALMAGDFLTPTFIGLTFQDVLPLNLWIDRAVLLETSWERRFADIVGRRTKQWNSTGLSSQLRMPIFAAATNPGSLASTPGPQWYVGRYWSACGHNSA